eukprot:tig00021352_g20717.t1
MQPAPTALNQGAEGRTCDGKCGELLRELVLTAESLSLGALGSNGGLSPEGASDRVRAALNVARARIDTLQCDALRLRGDLHRVQDEVTCKAAGLAAATDELEGLYSYVARLEAAKDELSTIKERISTRLEAAEARNVELEAKLAVAAEEVAEKRRMLAELGFWEPVGRRDEDGIYGPAAGQRWDTDTIRALCEAALAKMEAVASEGKDLVPRELDSLRSLLATLQDNLHATPGSAAALSPAQRSPAKQNYHAGTRHAPGSSTLCRSLNRTCVPMPKGSQNPITSSGRQLRTADTAPTPRAIRHKVRPSLSTLLGTPSRDSMERVTFEVPAPPEPVCALECDDSEEGHESSDFDDGETSKYFDGAAPQGQEIEAAEGDGVLEEMQTLHISTQLLCNTLQAEVGHKERSIHRLESEVKRLRLQNTALRELNSKLTQELAEAFANLKFLTTNLHVLQDEDVPIQPSPPPRALLASTMQTIQSRIGPGHDQITAR